MERGFKRDLCELARILARIAMEILFIFSLKIKRLQWIAGTAPEIINN
jgi:hypothetical protein